MSMKVREIKEWLNTLDDDEMVGIGEGGLDLRLEGSAVDVYIEIGGVSDDDDPE